jgi:hypothetical protein
MNTSDMGDIGTFVTPGNAGNGTKEMIERKKDKTQRMEKRRAELRVLQPLQNSSGS